MQISEVKAMSKNRLAIIFVMMIFLLAITPTALGAPPSQTSQYQDVKWMEFYNAQSSPIISDLNDISAALDANDYNKVYDGSHRLSVFATEPFFQYGIFYLITF
jgi:hypothetical protein